MNLENGKVLTSKSVGTGPSSYAKRIYRAAVSQMSRNTALGYWQEAAAVSLCNIHRLVLIIEVQCVPIFVPIQYRFILVVKQLNALLNLCATRYSIKKFCILSRQCVYVFRHDYKNKQKLFPQRTLIRCSLYWAQAVRFYRGRNLMFKFN